MKPVRLKVKGLNSFLEEQEIDFTKAMRYGFFGIFGPTGSGKTTIIDAITIALYGEVPRYDGDRKSKQFINTNTDTMAVSFEFEMGDVPYVVERTFKTKNDKVVANTARIYKNDELKQILEEKPSKVNDYVKQMIGLGYDDFTRTVILPQGKFSEFLHLANLERRSMLERIFKLEQYGENLNKRVRIFWNEEQNKLNLLDGKLEIFGDVTVEMVQQEEASAIEEILQIEQWTKRQKEKEQQHLKVREVKAKVDEKRKYEDVSNALMNIQPQIEIIQQQWQKAQKADQILPLLEQQKEIRTQILDNQRKYEKIAEDMDQCTQKEAQQQQSLTNITKQKEEELPRLQEEKFKLGEGIELQKELRVIQKEREEFVQQFKEERANCKKIEEQRAQLAQEKELLQEQLKNILEELEKVKVRPTFRNQIQQGYAVATAYLEEEKKYKRLLEKQHKIEQQLGIDQKQLVVLEKEGKQKQEVLEILEKKITQRQQEKVDIAVQMALKETILSKESKYEQIKVVLAETKKLEEERDFLSKEIENVVMKDNQLQQQLTEDEQALAQLQNTVTAMENEKMATLLREHLILGEPCPVCCNVVHTIAPMVEKEDDHPQPSFEKERTTLEQRVKKNAILLETNRYQLGDYQQKITALQVRLEQMAVQDAQPENLEKEIQLEKQRYEQNQQQMAQWEADMKQYEQEKIQLIQWCHSNQIQRATTQQKQEKDAQMLQEQKKELEEINVQQQKRIIQCEEILKEAGLFPGEMDLFLQWHETIKVQDEQVERLSQKEQFCRRAFEENTKGDLHSAELHSKSEKELERIQTIGSQKKEVIENYTKKLKAISDEEDLVARFNVVELRINTIIENEKIVKQQLEEIQKIKQNLTEQQLAIFNQLQILQQVLKERETLLDNKIASEGFVDEKDVCVSVLPLSEQQRMEQQVKMHQEQVVDTQNNLKRVALLLKGEDSDNIAQKEALLGTELQQLMEMLEYKKKESTIREEKIKKMKEDLKQIEQLQKERKTVMTRFDLLSDLVSVLKCKFVEYIATKQLEYITMEASERLKQITNGRYALELDETDFIIRDDFNGGIRRSPKTLSGGETFVTSLCLALALSSHIQLNNQNPLEFFFLDEGFGTLDNTSLEHVISSLERLRMEKINIGIISHSEELKERVPAKIVVTPAKQYTQGSRIVVE